MNAFAAIAGALSMAGVYGQSGAPTDVPTNHWAYPAVSNLYQAGILKGYPDGTFKGSRPASRFELAQAVFALVQSQNVSTQQLERQIADLKSKIAASLSSEATVDKERMAQLRDQVLALRAQIDEVKAQREQVAPLNDKFQSLRDRLRKIREDLEASRKDLEKTKKDSGS